MGNLLALVRPEAIEDGGRSVVRCKEEIVMLSKVLDQLFVLVELLKILHSCVSLFTMGSISKHAALEVGMWDSGKMESSGEMPVTNGVIVLQIF